MLRRHALVSSRAHSQEAELLKDAAIELKLDLEFYREVMVEEELDLGLLKSAFVILSEEAETYKSLSNLCFEIL